MSVRLIKKALGKDIIQISDLTLQYNDPDGGTGHVAYRLSADGRVYSRQAETAGALSVGAPWCLPLTSAANYEVEAVITVGTLTSGTTGSGVWQALTSDRTWILENGNSFDSAEVVFNIRRVGTTSLADTATIIFILNTTSL